MIQKTVILFISLISVSCAIKVYSGPKKSDSEVSYIESNSTLIISIDDIKPPTSGDAKGTFIVSPGIHAFVLRLDYDSGSANYRSNVDKKITFTAYPGHSYQIVLIGIWNPIVIDKNTNKVIPQRPEVVNSK